MRKNNLQVYADVVIDNFDNNFKQIKLSNRIYNVKKIFENFQNLSNKEIDVVLELCMNDYLGKIKDYSISLNQLNKFNASSDNIIDYIEFDNDETLLEEVFSVTDDLVMKISGHNGRKMSLPLDVDIIKKYCIHSMISERDVQKTLLYIVLNLCSIYHYLNDSNLKKIVS